jgi:hypothetical protein
LDLSNGEVPAFRYRSGADWSIKPGIMEGRAKSSSRYLREAPNPFSFAA